MGMATEDKRGNDAGRGIALQIRTLAVSKNGG